MSEDSRLHIDADWKSEAAQEKERLAEQEKREPRAQPGVPREAQFLELVELLGVQASAYMMGLQGPGGEHIPANPAAAKHFIDLIEVLERKTKGNLSEEESRAVSTVLYELRMQYVEIAQALASAAMQSKPATT